MKNLFTLLTISLLLLISKSDFAQEVIRPPDAVTAINAPFSPYEFSLPQSNIPPDESVKIEFNNTEGVEASLINQSWAGMYQVGSIRPPDPHGAAGPSGIIQVVNLRIAYWTKTGTQTWIDDMGGAGNFFPSSTGSNLSDPRALYDHNSARFYVMVQENSTTQAFLNLAVSKDNNPSTSTTTEWWFYRFDITETIGATKYGADYPGFGFDGQAIYTTFNMYPLPLSGSPKNCQIIIARKDSAIAGTLNYIRRVYTGYTSYNGFTLQPGTVMSSTGPTNKAYFGEICLGASDSIRIWALTNPITTPVLTSYKMQVPNNGGSIGTGAPQLGTTTKIATLSSRTQGNAFWFNGALWFCNTAGGSIGKARIYYYKVNTNDFADANPTLAESGYIDGGTGVWTYQPSIGANRRGDVCLVYTESSSSKYPEIKFTIRKAAASTWDSPTLLKASPSYSNSDRWGDYASVTADPSDSTFWVTHEWSRSSASHNWGTWWGNIVLPITLEITLIPEGFYNSGLNRLNMKDTVNAYLRSITPPYVKVDSAKAVIDSLTFTGYFNFYKAPSGTYYLSMHHRNTIETWGGGTGTVTRGMTYSGINYTLSQSSVWGSNQKLKGTKWCFFGGDVNQDGVVDLTDMINVDNDNKNFVTGYVSTDANGDLTIDLSDMIVVDNNNALFVTKIVPPGALTAPKIKVKNKEFIIDQN